MKWIDTWLNQISMYRLTLLYLGALILIAFIGSVGGIFPFTPLSLILSVSYIVTMCYVTNRILGFFLQVPTNTESFFITALILSLIFTPATKLSDYFFLGVASCIAITSKFIFTYKKKHIFNPAAIAAVIVSLFFNQSASWWVGTAYMAPFVIIGGMLLIHKIQKEALIWSFTFGVLIASVLFAHTTHSALVFDLLTRIFFHSSFLFLGFVMLTEPITLPPTKRLQIAYGVVVGILFSSRIDILSITMTPEIALCIGNIYSFCVSPHVRRKIYLKKIIFYGTDTADYIFSLDKPISFVPGQYMEWTLPHKQTDQRGNRRYFTLASSPTESELHLGVRFYPHGSSFKKALRELTPDTPILIGSVAGDFILPAERDKKFVFLAGGIGITPFRSMIKYLIDTHEKRDITLFYSNSMREEIAYVDVFSQAEKEVGLHIIYTLTDEHHIPPSWTGEKGRISAEMIKKHVPDYQQRYYFLSGPHAMVHAYETLLMQLHIPSRHIKKDFFPGFA